ncbi:MAG: hypothetical protein R3277_03855 [Brumimicrobium sp.]|nr:hypothetical protein [Brumimicrobium sp.]
MKSLIIFIFFLPLFGLSQLTDTTCIKYRWISLKPNQVNADIFLLDSNINKKFDLVHVIKDLVENDKLNIYDQNSGPFGLNGWYKIDYDEELEKMLNDSLEGWGFDYYFQKGLNSDRPLINVYGEDSISKDGDYVYPATKFYTFPSSECDEIRVKEKRVYSDSLQGYHFIPVGLSFYFGPGKYWRGHEKFWVDIDELFDALENPSKYPWYKALKEKDYRGFQYMQTSCYDQVIKN